MFSRFSCLQDFVGYGPERPRFVFLGIEEKGDGGELSFETRCAWYKKPLFDKNDACRLLARTFREHGQTDLAEGYEQAMEPGSARVWKFCAMTTAAVRAPDDWATTWNSEYKTLGTESGDTLLAPLFAVPKPRMKYWPQTYQEWFGFKSYNRYYAATWPSRKNLIQAVVLDGLPANSVIICYGKSFWDNFSDLVHVRRKDWSELIQGRAEYAVTPKGQRVVRTGFPFGRPSGGPVTEEHIPLIAKALSA